MTDPGTRLKKLATKAARWGKFEDGTDFSFDNTWRSLLWAGVFVLPFLAVIVAVIYLIVTVVVGEWTPLPWDYLGTGAVLMVVAVVLDNARSDRR